MRRFAVLFLFVFASCDGTRVRDLTRAPGPGSTATPTPEPTTVSAPVGERRDDVYITFYGYDDNDDGNGHYGTAVISDPGLHAIATEDLGTYDRPSTFATDYAIAKAGSLIYVPKVRKYYIMEDTCVECTADRRAGKTRVDLFIGGNTALQGRPLNDCEEALTADPPYSDVIIMNPTRGWPVSTTPLFSTAGCQSTLFPVPPRAMQRLQVSVLEALGTCGALSVRRRVIDFGKRHLLPAQ